MGRIAVPEVEKIRRQIIALSIDDFFEVKRDMEIIEAIREEIAAKEEQGVPK